MQGRTAAGAWLSFFCLSILSGVYFLGSLARLPSDGGAGLLGLSFRRLAILAPMALLILGLAALLVQLLRSEGWRARWARWMVSRPFLLGGCCLAAGLLAPLAVLDLLRTLFRDSGDFRYSAFASRLAPLFTWLALVGLLLLVTILIFHRKDLLLALDSEAGAARLAGWIWLTLALLAGLLALTGIGFSNDLFGAWGYPTVPLLEWQIWLALVAVLGLTLLLPRVPAFQRFASGHEDLIFSLLIWGLAALLWASHPLIPGYFATPGRAPNFEIYPFSDGQIYDQYAQSILVGNGFMGAIPHRPLYIVFLAALHALAGQDYLKVILLQQLILAVFPVILYWIGKELHSRPAGILAAMLVILREITAIRGAPFTDNISYSKLYFSELPTAICLGAFTLFVIRWMKAAGQGQRWSLDALLAGGFLGMAMLIRTQSFGVLPLVAILALFVFRRNLRSRRDRREWSGWLRGLTLATLGVLVCVLPWLARNYPVAGGLAFDNANSQTMVLAQRYNNLSFSEPIPRQPGESEAHYSSRLMGMAVQGMLRDPANTAWLVANHFANNQISNLLIFPIRLRIADPAELAWPVSPFWQEWDGSLSAIQTGVLLANLGVLAAGLAGALNRQGVVGWTPLLINLAYNLSTAVFRSSGGRFLLPVDWVAILLFAMGGAHIFAWLLQGSRSDQFLIADTPGLLPPHPARPGVLLAVIAAFLMVGASLPLADSIVPQRYSEPTEGMAAAFSAALSAQGEQPAALRQLAQEPGTVFVRGRALYPRFYNAGEEEPKTAKKGYAGLPYARLVFYVVGSQNALVVLPLEQPPVYLPNVSDVWVAGCLEEGYIQAAAVLVTQGNRPLYAAQVQGCNP